jgi:hypothetical protein
MRPNQGVLGLVPSTQMPVTVMVDHDFQAALAVIQVRLCDIKYQYVSYTVTIKTTITLESRRSR